jgi:hypothetical protein
MRHSFVSRMAEGRSATQRSCPFSGHLSCKMLERCSHVRGEAERKAISVLDTARGPDVGTNSGTPSEIYLQRSV